jgi:hypothetical protein
MSGAAVLQHTLRDETAVLIFVTLSTPVSSTSLALPTYAAPR